MAAPPSCKFPTSAGFCYQISKKDIQKSATVGNLSTRQDLRTPRRVCVWSKQIFQSVFATSPGRLVSMPYESWVERQIREATERGEFDNLPGQGKPIKGLNGREEENWWVKAYLEREQLPLPLPTSLALRKEVTELPDTLADVPDEQSVREIVSDLNHRIAASHRIRADGPPIVVRVVDVEATVAAWRRRRRSSG